jgi:hypothetical protein
MIIECSYCESKVDATVLASNSEYDEEIGEPFKVSLFKCPVCQRTLLGCQEYIPIAPNKEVLGYPKRLWPEPEKYFDLRIPHLVREVLGEANACHKSKAYNACAVMCGRVLEEISAEHNIKEEKLEDKLKGLLEKGIIDKNLYAWSEALRLHRNFGAHASNEKVSKEDARDLLEFANAICDYVFVLTKKFEEFKKRKKKK